MVWTKLISSLVSVVALVMLLSVAVAEATPLGPEPVFEFTSPELRLVADGVGLEGLHDVPPFVPFETVTVNVPGPVHQAFLYWGGREVYCEQDTTLDPTVDNCVVTGLETDDGKDQRLTFDASEVIGSFIGSEANWNPNDTTKKRNNYGYRADVTERVKSVVAAGPGPSYSFQIGDGDSSRNLNPLDGATLLVIYRATGAAFFNTQLFEGLDFVHDEGASAESRETVPVHFNYDPDPSPRTARLIIAGGDGEAGRGDVVRISDNPDKMNFFAASDGNLWDTETIDITIPAGVSTTTVQLFSEGGSNPDSVYWVLGALVLPVSNAGIDIRKQAEGADSRTFPAGSLVTFEIVVTNTGEVDLTNVTVTDEVTPECANTDIPDLAVGDEFTYQCTTTSPVVAGFTNEACVSATLRDAMVGDCDASTVEIVTSNIDIRKQAEGADTRTFPAGSPVTFEIVVTNTGEVDLANVTVTDELTPECANPDIGDLPSGESVTYTCTTTDPVAAGFTNEACVSGTLEDETVGDCDISTVVVVTPNIDIRKQAEGPDNRTFPAGSPVTFEIVVTNTGEVDLSNVTVTDELTPECANPDIGDLAAGASVTYTCTTTDPVAAGFANEACVSGTMDDETVGDCDISTVVVVTPNIDIRKQAEGPDNRTFPAGSDVTFEIVVTNTGEVDLSNVTVTDELTPECANPDIGDLAAGESFTYTCTTTDPVAAGFANEACVSGTMDDETVGDCDISTVVVVTPNIDIRKQAEGADTRTFPAGSPVTFEIVVTNTGEVDLANVTVTDELTPECANPDIGDLPSGESFTYTCTTTDPVAAGFTNEACVSGTMDDESVGDCDASTVEIVTSNIDIRKQAEGPDTRTFPAGSPVTFEIVVTNTGEVDLSNVTVTDELTPECANPDIGDLAAGETVTYTCTTTDPVAAGFLNEACVSGTLEDETVGDCDISTVVVVTPNIDIRKQAEGPDNRTFPAGSPVTFEIVVTNTGEVDLSNVTVTDELTPECANPDIGDLAAGASVTYTCTTTDPVAAGFLNEACVSGTMDDETVGDCDISTVVVVTPNIDIRKQAEGPDTRTFPAGSPVTFEIVVTNTGEVDLTNVTVTDELTPECANPDIGDLAAGESFTYTCTTTDPVAAGFTNEACVSGTMDDESVGDCDASTVEIVTSNIDIRKQAEGPDTRTFPAGSPVTFEIVVTNTGEVDLANVTVTDELTPECANPDIGDLAAGASVTYTCTTTDPVAAGFTNEACVSGTLEDETVGDCDASTVVVVTPNIDIRKQAEGPDTRTFPAGSDVTFEIVVTNTGEVDLSNVTVTDELTPECANPDIGDLAAGASVTYTCTTTDPVAAGFLNEACVSGTLEDEAVGDCDISTVVVVTPNIDIRKQAEGPDNRTFPAGSPVTFEIVVTNTGEVDLTNVTVTDELTPECANPDIGDLPAGESVTYTCTTTDPVAAGFTNEACVSGTMDDESVGDCDSSTVVVVTPNIDIRKQAEGADSRTFPAGSSVTFEIVVTNTGEVDLANVTVTDEPTPECANPNIGDLPAGESVTYTCTTTDPVAAGFTNEACVSGTMDDESVGDCDTSTVQIEQDEEISAIDIEKWTKIVAAPPVVVPPPPGGSVCEAKGKLQQITMLYTGDNVLQHTQKEGKVKVSGDPKFAAVVRIISGEDAKKDGKRYFDGIVKLGEEFVIDARNAGADRLKSDTTVSIFSQDGTLLQTIVFHTSCSQPLERGNKFGGIVVVDAASNDGNSKDNNKSNDKKVDKGNDNNKPSDNSQADGSNSGDQNDDSATSDPTPDFGVDADTPPGPEGQVGDKVIWTYFVTNTGEVPLANVVVVDNNGTPGDASDDFSPTFVSGDANGDDLLDLDETWLYQATGQVKAGQYANIGHVSGDDPEGTTVRDQDLSHYIGVVLARIDIEKWTRIVAAPPVVVPPPVVPPPPGGDVCVNKEKPQKLTMRYTGKNILAHSQKEGKVIVSGDPRSAAEVRIVSGEKADGTGKNYFDGNVKLGEHFVIDAGKAGEDKLKSDTSVWIFGPDGTQLQAIEFHTSCSQPLEIGDQFGGIQLVDAAGKDSNSKDKNKSDKQNQASDAGNSDGQNKTNDAGNSGDQNDDSATSDPTPDFGVDADTPTGPEGQVGDKVIWTYFVTNTGEVPLANVVVVDNNGTPGDASDDFSPTFVSGDANGDDLLDLDETWRYQAMGQVKAGQYANIGHVSGDDPDGTTVRDQDPSHHIGVVLTRIDIEKLTRIAGAPAGGDVCETLGKPGVFTWRYTGDNVLNHSQKEGKVKVRGQVNGESPVHITSGKSFDGNVKLGESFDSENGKVTIKALDGRVLKTIDIHTSCSQPMVLGDQYGGVLLAGYTSKDGKHGTFDPASDDGVDADTPTGPEGQVGDEVTWTYLVTNTGDVPLANVVVLDDNGTLGNTSDDFSPDYVSGDADGNELLDLDETWRYQATGQVKAGQYANIGHVSGAGPDGTSVRDEDPSHHIGVTPAGDVCESKGKPQRLTMRYTGDNVLQHSQKEGKVKVTGDPKFAAVVRIISGENADGTGKNYFDGTVKLGEEFVIDATKAGGDKLESDSSVWIFGPDGTQLQEIVFHTSCSQPLEIGDQYGGIQLIDVTVTAK